MISLPSQMTVLLRDLPMAAWDPTIAILRHIVKGSRSDGSTPQSRAQLIANWLPSPPQPVAIATKLKAQ